MIKGSKIDQTFIDEATSFEGPMRASVEGVELVLRIGLGRVRDVEPGICADEASITVLDVDGTVAISAKCDDATREQLAHAARVYHGDDEADEQLKREVAERSNAEGTPDA